MINNNKGEYMSMMTKEYDVMKSKIDKLLDKVETLIENYDNKFDTNISNDISLEINSLKEKIEDNACDEIDRYVTEEELDVK